MLLVDPAVDWNTKDAAKSGIAAIVRNIVSDNATNSAIFFAGFRKANPLLNNQVQDFVPCGAMAGIFARTDAQRGVWKAPAGLDASLTGAQALSVLLTDDENGELNPLGINCLRTFPAVGRVVWGSRTLAGNDLLRSGGKK